MKEDYAPMVYCAYPTIEQKQNPSLRDKITEFVQAEGYAPVVPFYALPVEFYTEENYSYEQLLYYCTRLIDACEELWVFGLSKGVAIEINHALKKNIPIKYRLNTLIIQSLEDVETFFVPCEKCESKEGIVYFLTDDRSGEVYRLCKKCRKDKNT